MKPVDVQVITYAPTAFYHCQHCELTFQEVGLGDRIHREQAREALPEELMREFHSLSEWVLGLTRRYGERVRIRVVDAASIEGVWKSLRYRVRRYPATVVAGTDVHVGSDFASAEPLIERHLLVGLPRVDLGGGDGSDVR